MWGATASASGADSISAKASHSQRFARNSAGRARRSARTSGMRKPRMPRRAGSADAAADIAALDDAVGVTTSPLSTFGWIDWAARWWRRASARAVLLEREIGRA